MLLKGNAHYFYESTLQDSGWKQLVQQTHKKQHEDST